MRYSALFAPALLISSLLSAVAAQAAPVLDKGKEISAAPTAPTLVMPSAPGLDKLTGQEFEASSFALPDVAMERGNGNGLRKPRFQVPEPNGLLLLSLGVVGMGVLRMRTKNQTL